MSGKPTLVAPERMQIQFGVSSLHTDRLTQIKPAAPLHRSICTCTAESEEVRRGRA